MKLRTTYEPYRPSLFAWLTVDDDTYDGTGDSGIIASIVGHGTTEAESVADWRAQWAEEHGASCWDEYVGAMQADDDDWEELQQRKRDAQEGF